METHTEFDLSVPSTSMRTKCFLAWRLTNVLHYKDKLLPLLIVFISGFADLRITRTECQNAKSVGTCVEKKKEPLSQNMSGKKASSFRYDCLCFPLVLHRTVIKGSSD